MAAKPITKQNRSGITCRDGGACPGDGPFRYWIFERRGRFLRCFQSFTESGAWELFRSVGAA